MILESLSIDKNQSYQPNPDGYTGRLRFRNQFGEITLNLDSTLSAKILAIVGENAVDSARDIANNLSAAVFTQPALQAPESPQKETRDDSPF